MASNNEAVGRATASWPQVRLGPLKVGGILIGTGAAAPI
jgi:hypothetical protein